MSSPPKPLNHSNFFVESKRIVEANNVHFLTLYFLFIFPLYFSLISLLVLFRNVLEDPQSLLLFNHCTSIVIALSFLYALFVFSLYVAGVATITYSTQQVLYGKPLNLLSTIKSLSNSFLPLASTTLASTLCLVSVVVPFLLSAASILNAIQILGFETTVPPNSNYLIGICVLALAMILGLFLCFFHVNLILAAVIAVTESKWGFDPLRQSFYLVKGMKRSSLWILLLRGISILVIPLGISTSLFTGHSRWDYLTFITIINTSMFASMFMMPLLTTYTVLYLYCKDLHEEYGLDIAEEISMECVSLAMDDNKLARESRVKLHVCCATLILVGFTIMVFAKLFI